MNLTAMLKKAPFPPGLYAICGPQGYGKTSLATGIVRTDYKYWGKWRFKHGQALADSFYKANGFKLNVDKSLYFSSPSMILDRRHGLKTHRIDLEQLGLPNDEYDVQYLPRGSFVFLHEVDVLAYCRDWQHLDNYLRLLAKYCRHNLITIIFDMQVGGALDKALRDLVIDRYFVYESGVKRFLLFWKQQKWKFICIHNQIANALKEVASFGIDLKIKIIERAHFRVWGTVFDCYDSYSGVPYFLKDIEKHNYQYLPQEDCDMTIKSIQRYCAAHPLEYTENKDLNKVVKLLKQFDSKGLTLVEMLLKELLKRNGGSAA